MRFDIITVLPELLQGPLHHSIMQRAIDKGLVSINIHQLRDFGLGKNKQVDDYQYGGGAGMVMMCEPLLNCIQSLTSQRKYNHIIYMTPDGDQLNQQIANTLSLGENLMIICGHYKGIDERIREHIVDIEISIGNYVLSGGELPAAVLVDTITRLIPGVLNDETSALFDSYQDDLLAPPVYTRPADFNGWKVPEVLLSGNDQLIENWRTDQALERTNQRRPELLNYNKHGKTQ
jgi:tRNA (guanine37-N1)-methyltransferase